MFIIYSAKDSFDQLLWCENYEKLASRSEIVGGSARHLPCYRKLLIFELKREKTKKRVN